MLEESGTVIAIKHEYMLVETQARSSCSHCSSTDCTTSVVSKLFGVKRNQLKLKNTLAARVGDRVVIGIPDTLLVRASVWGYFVPLLVMILFAVAGSFLGMSEASQSLLALGGLAFGFIVVRWVTTKISAQQQFRPQLLRVDLGGGAFRVPMPNPVRN